MVKKGIKQKIPAVDRKYLTVEYVIINAFENKRSKVFEGRLFYAHKNGFWMEVHSIKTDGMHISFGDTTMTRNTLELSINTMTGERLKARGEVEWYELIPHGNDYKFNVGIIILDMQAKDRTTFDKLFKIYNN